MKHSSCCWELSHAFRRYPMLTGEAPRKARGTTTETRLRGAWYGSPRAHWTRARPGVGPGPEGCIRPAPPPRLVRPRGRPHVELPGDPRTRCRRLVCRGAGVAVPRLAAT